MAPMHGRANDGTMAGGRRIRGAVVSCATTSKLAAKQLRPHGYGKQRSALGESESDSDGEGAVQADPVAGRGQVQGGERPRLPWGDASKYQWKPPAEGQHLVGWAVMAYFPTDDKWYTGVVVRHVSDSS